MRTQGQKTREAEVLSRQILGQAMTLSVCGSNTKQLCDGGKVHSNCSGQQQKSESRRHWLKTKLIAVELLC
jgi:hypothetical protein